MNEFVTVSSSSYDPASLATKLTEKSAQGWEIVAIVPTGGDVTAFLRRASDGAAAESSPAMAEAAAPAMAQAAPAAAEAAPSEPAGWAVAPEPAPASTAPATVIQTTSPMASIDTPNYAAATPAAPTPAPTPSVPAGWYADPAGRFDLRYWDGGTWTEHVSRAGQQFTDAPVA